MHSKKCQSYLKRWKRTRSRLKEIKLHNGQRKTKAQQRAGERNIRQPAFYINTQAKRKARRRESASTPERPRNALLINVSHTFMIISLF